MSFYEFTCSQRAMAGVGLACQRHYITGLAASDDVVILRGGVSEGAEIYSHTGSRDQWIYRLGRRIVCVASGSLIARLLVSANAPGVRI